VFYINLYYYLNQAVVQRLQAAVAAAAIFSGDSDDVSSNTAAELDTAASSVET